MFLYSEQNSHDEVVLTAYLCIILAQEPIRMTGKKADPHTFPVSQHWRQLSLNRRKNTCWSHKILSCNSQKQKNKAKLLLLCKKFTVSYWKKSFNVTTVLFWNTWNVIIILLCFHVTNQRSSWCQVQPLYIVFSFFHTADSKPICPHSDLWMVCTTLGG